jgi:GntR family transcriptional regulator
VRAPVPKYHLVKTLLLERLEREYVKGARIPSAMEIAASFGVSRITVEQALDLLEADGVISRRQGSGTFFQGAPYKREEAPLSGLLETVFRQRPDAHTKILGAGWVNAPSRVSARLDITLGSKVAELGRVGIIDGSPIMLISMWLLPELGELVLGNLEELQRSTSVMSFLRKKRKLKFGPTRQLIRATLADPAFATDLGVEVGAPVVQADRIYHEEAGRPVIYSESLYRSDRYSFEVTMKE